MYVLWLIEGLQLHKYPMRCKGGRSVQMEFVGATNFTHYVV